MEHDCDIRHIENTVVMVLIFLAVCSEYNHVRTWNVTRFRGMISTQPGSTPLASFNVVSLEDSEQYRSYTKGNELGNEMTRQSCAQAHSINQVPLLEA